MSKANISSGFLLNKGIIADRRGGAVTTPRRLAEAPNLAVTTKIKLPVKKKSPIRRHIPQNTSTRSNILYTDGELVS